MSWLPKRAVVVPIDFSSESLAAADAALELVSKPSDLYVVHVLAPMAKADPGVIWGTIDDESRKTHAAKMLGEQLDTRRFAGTNLSVAIGDPGQEIAEHARRVGADLIVLPSHGRTGMERLLIGSVAERVVRLASCPVLVLRR